MNKKYKLLLLLTALNCTYSIAFMYFFHLGNLKKYLGFSDGVSIEAKMKSFFWCVMNLC